MTEVYATGWQSWNLAADRPGNVSAKHYTLIPRAGYRTLCGLVMPADAEGSIASRPCRKCQRTIRDFGYSPKDV